MLRKQFIYTVLLLSSYTLVGQNVNRVFEKAFLNSNGFVEVVVNDGRYRIQSYSKKIVETTFIPNGEKFNPTSHAVVLKPAAVNLEFKEYATKSVLKTNGIAVIIQKSPFQISYSYKGKQIISEKEGYSKVERGETIEFNLTPDEILYGGGARALGMNRRGNRLQLYNRAHYGYETKAELMNFTMPIVMSSNTYMIHFDNAPIGYLDIDSKKDNTLTYETISGRKTYQVIVGDSWLDLIDNYTDLTGKQPLPPRWALGNFSSRFGYHSQEETESTINKFFKEKIPVDAVILDLYWFGKDIQGTMGNLEVYKDSFPDVKKMISDFKKKGVQTVFITEPFILTTSKRWQEAVDKKILAKDSVGNPFTYDFYFGNTGLIDVYNPKGKSWFWNIYKEIKALGVTGFWGDLGEPEVHPSNLIHQAGTADEVHNIYGHDWARLIFEGYQKDFPNERPFILMRAGYSGSQRFGMIPWSGDVNRTWGGLQSQAEIALQMGMQGLGYMHSDLGGFAGANLDNELYTRWLQYGVFQPVFRPHAQEEVPSEPVFREPKTKAAAKKSIELRYKLLPYNYTLAFENNQKGSPLMRPIFFEEPNNVALQTNAATYLWGNDFLITPITHANVSEKEVYFLKGSNWFDFYTDEKITGGQSKMIVTKVAYIPTYVRAGAFIPMAKPMQTTEKYTGNDFDLHYYHDVAVEKSNGQLYNDDSKIANAFEKGKYELLSFKSKFSKNCLEIVMKAQLGTKFQSVEKEIELHVHNIQQKPRRIKINGKRKRIVWDEKSEKVRVLVKWNPNKKNKISIKL